MVGTTWSLVSELPGIAASRSTAAIMIVILTGLSIPSGPTSLPYHAGFGILASSPSTPVGNFSASINRLVDLVALAGSGILALVWARVALSWFSNDITKKIQAKDRARDALVGTLLFMAAVTGLFYGLAHWVLTGT